MYQKYQSESLVLSARERGENDRLYALYTRDFGLVRARATAVRKESSRMRYALQTLSYSNVSLVRGKRGWRLAGATAIEGAHGSQKGVAALARIAQLVTRLVHGEEKNEYLFSALAEAHDALMRSSAEGVQIIELVCVARILFALGYLSAEAFQSALFTHTAYGDEQLREAEVLHDKLLSSINKAIAETQL